MGTGRHGNEHVLGVQRRNWEEYQTVPEFLHFTFIIDDREAHGEVGYLNALRNENMSQVITIYWEVPPSVPLDMLQDAKQLPCEELSRNTPDETGSASGSPAGAILVH